MGEWGLRRLAEALRPFVNEEDAEAALAGYWPLVEAEWLSTFRKKLGLLVTEEEVRATLSATPPTPPPPPPPPTPPTPPSQPPPSPPPPQGDEELIRGMLATMQRSGADFTNTFRSLSRIDPPTTDEGCVVRPQTFDPVLEYILAQSASLEAMRKKSVAAFHPQARCSPLPNLPTSHTSHSSEPHSTSPTTTILPTTQNGTSDRVVCPCPLLLRECPGSRRGKAGGRVTELG